MTIDACDVCLNDINWFRMMLIEKPFFKNYFKPRDFEFSGNSSIYSKIGIKFFKKYLPTSGDWVKKRWGSPPLIKANHKNPYLPFYDYEKTSRIHELRHWLGMIAFVILLFFFDGYKVFDILFVGFLFLVINVYPILLQRHNRIRILNVLKRHGQASPYE